MIATNEAALTDLLRDAIVAIVPRLTTKQAQRWKPYERAVSGSSTTRRFRLIWTAGMAGLQPGGAMAGDIFEHFGELRVRTDYAGVHQTQTELIIDDFHQIGDALTKTKGTTTGVVLVIRVRTEYADDSAEDDDTVLVDHIYTVRYMRRLHL